MDIPEPSIELRKLHWKLMKIFHDEKIKLRVKNPSPYYDIDGKDWEMGWLSDSYSLLFCIDDKSKEITMYEATKFNNKIIRSPSYNDIARAVHELEKHCNQADLRRLLQ